MVGQAGGFGLGPVPPAETSMGWLVKAFALLGEGEPPARSSAWVCSKAWKRFLGALHPPAPLPPLSW